jgi:rRNA maturation endonuclease Nob1
MPNHFEYSIKTAAFSARCFACDEEIKRGEAYVEIEGERVCLRCGLPARRLRLLKKEKHTRNDYH